MFGHFGLLFFSRRTRLPGSYTRWMEQVKRPLQLSDSCRLCPIYIRDEPLRHARARAHNRTPRNAFSVRCTCTAPRVCARTMRDVDRGAITELAAHHFIPFLRLRHPPANSRHAVPRGQKRRGPLRSVDRARCPSPSPIAPEKLARINIRLSDARDAPAETGFSSEAAETRDSNSNWNSNRGIGRIAGVAWRFGEISVRVAFLLGCF